MFVSQESTLDPDAQARCYGSLSEGLVGELDHFLSQRPLDVSVSPCKWRVRILRFLEIEADERRREVLAYWVNAHGRRVLVEVRVLRIDRASELPAFWIDRVIGTPWWLRFAVARWFPGAIDSSLLEQWDPAPADVEAALAKAHEFLCADRRFADLQREVPLYLGPCARVAAAAARVCGARSVISSAIPRWWKAAEDVVHAEGETPHLSGLCLAYAGAMAPLGEPSTIAGCVRKRLRAAGLSKEQWRLLARKGDAWLDRAWCALFDAADVGPWAIAVAALTMRQRVGELEPSAAALRLWMSIHPPAEDLIGSGNEAWAALPASFLREGLLRAPSDDSADRLAWLADCDAIARWLLATPVAGRNARARRPWASMLDAARAHAARTALMAGADGVSLPFDAPPFEVHDVYELVPLDSALQVLEEGWRMRHCAWTYVADAREGRAMLWHLRRDGESVGTLAITRPDTGSQWSRVQVRGFANRAPTREMEALGRLVMERCNEWWLGQIWDLAVEELERERAARGCVPGVVSLR